jgi:cell division septation protein DedD
MSPGSPLNSMPVASYQAAKGLYAEGRYNYEALNTFSIYLGKTYAKESVISYSISPIAGAVMGGFNGGSIGANIGLSYKNFYIYSQPQYSFSLENAVNNFIYSWTDITYSPTSWLSAGISLQHTKPYQSKSYMQNGFVVELAVKKFAFPMYIFNPLTKDRSFVVGANFELNFKKKKTSEVKKDDSFNKSFPFRALANNTEDQNFLTEKEHVIVPNKIKPAVENIIKIRRVNVVIRTKDPDEEIVTKPNILAPKPGSIATPTPAPAVKVPRKLDTLKSNAVPAKKSSTPLTEPDNNTPAAEQIEASSSHDVISYYAIILGPFKSEEEARALKSQLVNKFTKEVILFSDAGHFKLRITGLIDRQESEILIAKAVNEGLKAATAIVTYNLRSLDALPFKNGEESFKATNL